MNAPLLAADDLRTEIISGESSFAALIPEWNALCDRVGMREPFARPHFLSALTLHDPESLRIVVARRRGKLEAVLPLRATRRPLAGLPSRTLESLSDDHSQRFDLTSCDDRAYPFLLEQLLVDKSWDVLLLRDVLADSRAEEFARIAERRGLPTGVWHSSRSPYLPLPATVAAFDAQLSAHFRANLRRRAKRLTAELGPLALERVSSASEIDEALDDGFRLEAAGWKGDEKTAIACNAKLVSRYRALAHSAARHGSLAIHFLRANDRRIAFHFALEMNGVYYLFKPGFAPALAKYGPGHLLIDRVARNLIARGMRELDFLGDSADWKSEWTSIDRPHRFRYLFRANALGRALCKWKFHWLPRIRSAAHP